MSDNIRIFARFDDGYFEAMPAHGWRRLNAEEVTEWNARSAARLNAFLETQCTEPWSDPPTDSPRLLIILSLIIGACLGCALTIAAYAFHLL